MVKKYIVLLSLAATIFLGCDSRNSNSPAGRTNHEHLKQKTDRSGPEYTSRYICPMHCKSSGSDTNGNCPVCKMKYEKNENYKEDR